MVSRLRLLVALLCFGGLLQTFHEKLMPAGSRLYLRSALSNIIHPAATPPGSRAPVVVQPHEAVVPATTTARFRQGQGWRHGLREGDEVPVTSPSCPATETLPQNPCCKGQGCCQAGKATVLAGSPVTWSHDTELVIVTSQVRPDEHTRTDARNTNLSWITDQELFPYVLCPFCTVELNPVCAVRTDQGFESAVYLAFIVYNYHRLPRSVAFVHGHSWVQNSRNWKKRSGKRRCTNMERLQELRPFLSEDIFIYLQATNLATFQSQEVLQSRRKKWERVSGQRLPRDLMNFSFWHRATFRGGPQEDPCTAPGGL